MKKPEILLITRPLTPPWDEASKNFAIELARNMQGYKFHILTGKKDKELPDNIVQHKIYHGPQWSTIQKAKLVLRLPGILKKNPNIKMIHLIFTLYPLNATILKRITRKFQGNIVYTGPCLSEKSGNLESMIFADHIVGYSKYTSKKFEVSGKPVETIPPFVKFDNFPLIAPEKRKIIRKKWGIGEKEKIILFPGEYSRMKAVSTLWDGFIKIMKVKPESYLFMACRPKTKMDVREEHKFANEVQKSGWGGRVRFLSTVKDMSSLYAAADLVVFPVSSMQGKFDFPFVLIESLATGTPIVTSDIKPLGEIWDDNPKLGQQFIFGAGNTKTFAKRCLEILSRDREVYDKKLSSYIRKRFSKDKVIKGYEELYKKVLKNKK